MPKENQRRKGNGFCVSDALETDVGEGEEKGMENVDVLDDYGVFGATTVIRSVRVG